MVGVIPLMIQSLPQSPISEQCCIRSQAFHTWACGGHSDPNHKTWRLASRLPPRSVPLHHLSFSCVRWESNFCHKCETQKWQGPASSEILASSWALSLTCCLPAFPHPMACLLTSLFHLVHQLSSAYRASCSSVPWVMSCITHTQPCHDLFIFVSLLLKCSCLISQGFIFLFHKLLAGSNCVLPLSCWPMVGTSQ
jgi:hypothetical protein